MQKLTLSQKLQKMKGKKIEKILLHPFYNDEVNMKQYSPVIYFSDGSTMSFINDGDLYAGVTPLIYLV